MSLELASLIIRESIGSFFLLVVLIGGYRILNRFIDVLDRHLEGIERQFEKANDTLLTHLDDVEKER